MNITKIRKEPHFVVLHLPGTGSMQMSTILNSPSLALSTNFHNFTHSAPKRGQCLPHACPHCNSSLWYNNHHHQKIPPWHIQKANNGMYVNNTILHTLNAIIYKQSKSSELTNNWVVQLLNYLNTNPDASIMFWAIFLDWKQKDNSYKLMIPSAQLYPCLC